LSEQKIIQNYGEEKGREGKRREEKGNILFTVK
jgi:hypothetical protein